MSITDDFLKTVELLPDLKGFNLSSISFTVYHSKTEPGQKSLVCVGSYQNKTKAEILVQTSKDFIFKETDVKNFKSKTVNKQKVFLDYRPKFEFFTKDNTSIFSWVKDDNVFSLKGEERLLKHILKSKPLNPKKIGFLKFVNYIPLDVQDYHPVFLTFSPDCTQAVYMDSTMGKTDVLLEIFEKFRPITKDRFYFQTIKYNVVIRSSCPEKEKEKYESILKELLRVSLNQME